MEKISVTGRKKNVRPLGSVRVSHVPPSDRIPKLPQFIKKEEKKIDKTYKLQGNAMTVPPPKSPEVKEEKPKPAVVKSGKSDSGSSTKSLDMVDKKELQEAKTKEKELRQQIVILEKEIENLKRQLKDRDETLAGLSAELAKQEEYYKKLYEAEKSKHEETKSALEKSEVKVNDLRKEVDTLLKEQQEKVRRLQEEYDRKLLEMAQVKEKEIAERDQKLARLKQQMAEALKGNSWERQQQLEELTKELGRIQEEADTLRLKLKSYKAKSSCSNCQENAAKVDKAINVIKEKDNTIRDMKSLITKFEKQLSQQDELLKQWAESKGHKVSNFPR